MSLIIKVQNAWQTAAHELGIEFVGPYSLGEGSEAMQFHGMVARFGSPKGTVFLATSTFTEDIGAASQLATEHGYYFSLIGVDSYDSFDRAHFTETLKDWGWHSEDMVPPQGFARHIPTEKKNGRTMRSSESR